MAKKKVKVKIENENKDENKEVENVEQTGQDDVGVETSTEEQSKIQDSGTDGSDSDVLVEEMDEATGSVEGEGVLDEDSIEDGKIIMDEFSEQSTNPIDPKDIKFEKPSTEEIKIDMKKELSKIDKDIIYIMDNNIPVNDIEISKLPGFELGSRRDPTDPSEIKAARIELTRRREEANKMISNIK